jgi:hypothetical protein
MLRAFQKTVIFISILCITMCASIPLVPAQENDLPVILWTQQFGLTQHDKGRGIAVDSADNIYYMGITQGAYHDQVHYGGSDIVVRKLGSDGSEQWTRQFGTAEDDTCAGVAVDSADNLYVSGNTHGAFPGQTHYGGYDFWVRKLGSDGSEQWTRQFGTSSSNFASGIAVDPADNIYMVGSTNDAFPGQTHYGGYDIWVLKLGSDGSEQWMRQFGTAADDYGRRIAVDSGANIYITGHTMGAFPGQTHLGSTDIVVRKLSSDGSEQWTRQFGTAAYDRAYGLACDQSDNIYLMGETDAAFPGQMHYGLTDIVVRKLSSDGSEQWTRQFGTAEDEYGYSIACDQSDNVHIAGETMGVFPGQTHYGATDLFFTQYDPSGSVQWIKQYGTPSEDVAPMIAVDSTNNVYVTGFTDGAFPGQTYYGGFDAFLMKYNPLLATTISATLSTVESSVHAPITISGTISEPVAGVPVTLSYKMDGEWSPLATVTSTADGSYSHTWTPTMIGTYQLRASWMGDDSFGGATSSDVSLTVSKRSTTLSCLASTSEVTEGELITVYGEISPAVSGVTVTLTYTKPDESTITRTVTTGADGGYSDSYRPVGEGQWSVTATWDGDSTHDGSSSLDWGDIARERQYFKVEKEEECLIATATYGSELSPQVQFLRDFRDNTVLSTFAGKYFMTVFNGFYYSFSPNVASVIADNSDLRYMMKGILYPLIGLLQVSSGAFSVFSFLPELGIVISGLIASALIGIVYFLPIALLINYVKKFKVPEILIRYLGLVWLSSVLMLGISEVLKNPSLMMLSTSLFVVSTMTTITVISLKFVLKQFVN